MTTPHNVRDLLAEIADAACVHVSRYRPLRHEVPPDAIELAPYLVSFHGPTCPTGDCTYVDRASASEILRVHLRATWIGRADEHPDYAH